MQSSYLVYRNVTVSIVMQYPQDWKTQEQITPLAFALMFHPPAGDPNQFQENVLLTIQPLLVPTPLEQFVEFNIRETQGRFQIVSSDPTTVGGLPAHQLVYTGSLNPQLPQLKISTLFAVTETRGYMLCYTARMQYFDQYLSNFQQMAQSLDII